MSERSCVQSSFKAALTPEDFRPPGESVHNHFLRPHLSLLLDSNVSKYSSRQVQVLAENPDLVPTRVLVDGTVYFFKPWKPGMYGYYEMQSYKQILADAGNREGAEWGSRAGSEKREIYYLEVTLHSKGLQTLAKPEIQCGLNSLFTYVSAEYPGYQTSQLVKARRINSNPDESRPWRPANHNLFKPGSSI